jgi:hypothetical protein
MLKIGRRILHHASRRARPDSARAAPSLARVISAGYNALFPENTSVGGFFQPIFFACSFPFTHSI